MPGELSLSTDQVAALVELARCGSLRAASHSLHLSEQGVRNRLLALEQRLGTELYRKSRGPRTESPLTGAGQRFLPHAQRFLARARELTEAFRTPAETREVHIASSQYLLMYLLIDAVRRFRAKRPEIHIRLSTHSEREIEEVLIRDAEVDLGVAAPYEPTTLLQYRHVLTLHWNLIAPPGHPLVRRKRVRLREIARHGLILFERGSTGRNHILEAFEQQGLVPQIQTETTTTEIVVRMVEAGLGVAIVPLMPGGIITRGRKVAVCQTAEPIRPIHSGVLSRTAETLSPAAAEFVQFITAQQPGRSTKQ